MPSRDCVGTVSHWTAHSSRAGANNGLCGSGDTQGRATWHSPCHVCEGGSPKSWRLATVAVRMTVSVRAVRAVRAVAHVTMDAFEFLAVQLESPSSSDTDHVPFCREGRD